MSVEDIASQSGVVFGIQHDWRDEISGDYVSTGSAETLVRRGRIASHYSLVNSFRNIYAKNYQNPLMFVEVIVCYISVVFLRHSVVVQTTELSIAKKNYTEVHIPAVYKNKI